jgi:hypothetical protein
MDATRRLARDIDVLMIERMLDARSFHGADRRGRQAAPDPV